MINLAIDTSIFRKNPQRDRAEYKALKKLVLSDKIKIFMPYIIEQEFITQQVADCNKINNDLKKNVNSLNSRIYTDKNYISELLENIKDLEVHTCNLIQSEFDTWCNELKIKKRPLNKKHLDIVLNNYFTGKEPYKSKKNRNDIPDAFIFQELIDIYNEKGNFTFIVHDLYFRDSCKKVGIDSYESLEEFIKNPNIQYLLKEHEVTKEKFTELKEYLIANKDYLEGNLSNMHITELENQTIIDYAIPSDDNSADISGLYEPDNVELDCCNTTYYGDNTIAIPTKFDIDVGAMFLIFKADYYVNEYSFSIVDDLNKHYYLVEHEFTLEVTATVILTIDINTFDFTKELTEEVFEEMVNLDSIEIDSIDSIEVKQDNKSKDDVTFICSKCKQSYSLDCENIEWEALHSNKRQMGLEIEHEALYENICKCGNKINITFSCWEYPVGAINYTNIKSDGVSNLIGNCTPRFMET